MAGQNSVAFLLSMCRWWQLHDPRAHLWGERLCEIIAALACSIDRLRRVNGDTRTLACANAEGYDFPVPLGYAGCPWIVDELCRHGQLSEGQARTLEMRLVLFLPNVGLNLLVLRCLRHAQQFILHGLVIAWQKTLKGPPWGLAWTWICQGCSCTSAAHARR